MKIIDKNHLRRRLVQGASQAQCAREIGCSRAAITKQMKAIEFHASEEIIDRFLDQLFRNGGYKANREMLTFMVKRIFPVVEKMLTYYNDEVKYMVDDPDEDHFPKNRKRFFRKIFPRMKILRRLLILEEYIVLLSGLLDETVEIMKKMPVKEQKKFRALMEQKMSYDHGRPRRIPQSSIQEGVSWTVIPFLNFSMD